MKKNIKSAMGKARMRRIDQAVDSAVRGTRATKKRMPAAATKKSR